MVRCGALCVAVWLGLMSQASAQEIIAANYADPTSAYPHAVLGDDEEWATLRVTVRGPSDEQGSSSGSVADWVHRIAAAPDTVFEDTAPRLWDVTGDGRPEVVVVVSHQRNGARLAIIGLQDGALTTLAQTPPIGTRFRWLAPVGAADLDGDGHIEVAYVDRPHLAKTLRVWRFTPDSFREVATLPGVTNHRIGEDFITGGIRDCGAGPEMILADARWRNIVSARMDAQTLSATPIAPFEGRTSVELALDCR